VRHWLAGGLTLLALAAICAPADAQITSRYRLRVPLTPGEIEGSGLPSPWQTISIGLPTFGGNCTYTPTTYTTTASGSFADATLDSGRMCYQAVTGDFDFYVHVTSLSGYAFSMVSAAVRESLNANARSIYARYQVTDSLNLMAYRDTTGGLLENTGNASPITAQECLRVTRVGDNFAAYVADEIAGDCVGASWVQIGPTKTIAMTATTYVGWYLISINDAVLATTTVDHPTFAAALPPTTPTECSVDNGGYRPCYEGFGISTTAGRNGSLCRVTSRADSGAGTLRNCLEGTFGPRVVVFDTSGVIALNNQSPIRVTSSYITIAGQTAPSPGIAINGEIAFDAHDIVVQHVRIRAKSTNDAIAIWCRDDCTNFVLDHVSVSYGSWDNISMSASQAAHPPGDMGIFESIIAEPLACRTPGVTANPCNAATYPGGGQYSNSRNLGIGDAWGGAAPRASVIRSIDANANDRHPEIGGGTRSVFKNNLYYNPSLAALGTIFLTNTNGKGGLQTLVVGNLLKPGPTTPGHMGYVAPDFPEEGDTKLIRVYSDVPNTARIYLVGNYYAKDCPSGACLASPTAQWSLATDMTGIGAIRATTPPFTLPSVNLATALSYSQVEAYVKAHAGARPAQRDCIDARIIADITNSTGFVPEVTTDRVTGCTDASGFSVLAVNTSPLYVDPTGPNDVVDAVGRTRREKLLEDMAVALETAP
jgi:hypothetical protein